MGNVAKDDLKHALAEKLFSTMFSDMMMDTALSAHKESRKRQAKDQAYVALKRKEIAEEVPFDSEPPPPVSSSQAAADVTANSQTNGNGANGQKPDPVLLDCLNCKRPIAFNRFAPHLASCMGINVGSRRGQPRNASKRMDSDSARSASPQIFGDERETTPSSSRGAGKRNRSPSESSARDAKRTKTETGRSTPHPRPNGISGFPSGHYANSVPKAPSKLRSSPVASQAPSGSPVESMENGYESDYIPSQQHSILSDSNSLSQPSGNVYDAEDKDPEYVIDVDGMVDTESDSDSGSE